MRRNVTDGTMIMWILEANMDRYDPTFRVWFNSVPPSRFAAFLALGFDSNVPAFDILTRPFEFTRDLVVQASTRGCFGAAIDLP